MEYYEVNDIEESIEKSLETLEKVFNKQDADYDLIARALEEYRDFCGRNVKKVDDKADRHHKKATQLIGNSFDQEWINEMKTLFFDLCSPKTAVKECTSLNKAINNLKESEASASQLGVLCPFVKSVFRVAKAWRDDYVRYKERNHIISYNDMERLFLRLLESEPEVQEYVRDNYRLVMVDEFQDSNPIQLKIFNRLSELIAPEGQSFWVGDPKQAIYGFRGADAELVNSVATHFTFYDDAEIHLGTDERNLGSGRLVESWRSRDTLVNLVNDCFKKAFAEHDNMDPLCITLEPHFTNENLKSDALVHWNVKANNMEQLSDAIAWKVKELLASGMMVRNGLRDEPLSQITPRSIAILSRTNEACKSLVKSLRKYGVPVSEAEDAIMQRMEIQLVVTLLLFVQNPNNKHTIACLKRLLWGESTEEILRQRIGYVNNLKEDGKDEWMADNERVGELKRLVERFESLSIPEIVEALIYECDIPSIVERWGDSNIRHQNLSTLRHLADDYDQMCLQMGLGTSINGFIYYLYTIEPDKEKDNMSDTVKVFTYHGSKGLEWPIVIMNELGTNSLEDKVFSKKQFASVREVVSEDRSTKENPFDKKYYLHLFPQTLKTNKSNIPDVVLDNILSLPLYQQMKQRASQEERRLLYVGMTRAKDCLYSIGYKGGSKWLINAGIEGVKEDNFWGVDIYKPVVQDVSAPEEKEAKTVSNFSIPRKPTQHTERPKQYLSPSTLREYKGYNAHRKFGNRGIDIPTKGWNKADYAVIGSCIHDFFAVFIPGNKEDNRKKAASVIGGYQLMPILGGHIDAIIASAEHLYAQLNAAFPLLENKREYPFSIQLTSGQTLRGEMDLLWFYQDAEGTHCILVDYKSYAGFEMDKHTMTHYAQLSAYTDALRKTGIDVTHAIVYYPVHGLMHELYIK
jgi:ATP-dependent exoDNAse (exonuclease V) beta subunit